MFWTIFVQSSVFIAVVVALGAGIDWLMTRGKHE